MRDEFPQLPLLEHLADVVCTSKNPKPFDGVALVGVQHVLETTGSLLESLLRLGLRPEATFLLGKFYSTNPGVLDRIKKKGVYADDSTPPAKLGYFGQSFQRQVDAMWRFALPLIRAMAPKKLLILDDGGQCIANAPFADLVGIPIFAVEQTTSGVGAVKNAPCPVIQVATSAVKRTFEPPLIAKAVIDRLPADILEADGQTIGVIGMGYIGTAVAQALLVMGKQVLSYDKTTKFANARCKTCNSLDKLTDRANILIGCSGSDVFLEHCPSNNRKTELLLLSCSSGDIEFRSILRELHTKGKSRAPEVLETIRGVVKGRPVRIYRGGYPFNFDRSHESVPAEFIQLTRSLLLAALLQSVTQVKQGPPGEQMLDPGLQELIRSYWASLRHGSGEISALSDISQITSLSGGRLQKTHGPPRNSSSQQRPRRSPVGRRGKPQRTR